MGKVRNHLQRDDHALAQWIMRKLVNHDPLSQREKQRGGQNTKRQRVEHNEGTSLVVYAAAGKVFQIEVQEIDEQPAIITG